LEHQFEGGLPHSEIHGSKGARPSPQLIAACHVLHRLSSPRHPSNALSYLSFSASMHGGDTAPPSWIFARTVCRCCPSTNALRRGRTLFHDVNLTPPAMRRRRSLLSASQRPLPSAISEGWWSQTGSNRRPHACKARALPTELWPLRSAWPRNGDPSGRCVDILTRVEAMVGPDRVELSTSRLSGVRSNHLSYGPIAPGRYRTDARQTSQPPRTRKQRPVEPTLGSRLIPATARMAIGGRDRRRETKTAARL
jgi:hypothetical protein